MSNFIRVAYGVVNKAGIDTADMSTDEVVAKFKELSGGEKGWGEKAYGDKMKKTKPLNIPNIEESLKKEVLNAGINAGKKYIEGATKYGQKLEKLTKSKYWLHGLSDVINEAIFNIDQNNDITIDEVNKIIDDLTNTKKTEIPKQDQEYYDYLLNSGFNKDEALQKLKERNETRQRMANANKDKIPREITSSAYERAKRINKRDVENFLGIKK